MYLLIGRNLGCQSFANTHARTYIHTHTRADIRTVEEQIHLYMSLCEAATVVGKTVLTKEKGHL